MKRFISAMLAVFMVAALFCVPAVAWSAPATYENTNDLNNTDLPTLYATYGTPTIDGTIDTAWADAYTMHVDRASNVVSTSTKQVQSHIAIVSIMWDEDNLYILEEQPWATPVYTAGIMDFWTGGTTCSCYYLIVPTDFTDDSNNNDGAVAMINVHTGDTTQGNVVDGYVTSRDKFYTSNAAAQSSTSWTVDTAVTTKTALTENGYLMETAIPWSRLAGYSPDYEATAGDVLGYLYNYKTGYSGNGNHQNAGDDKGFQALELLADGATNPTADPIIPDFSWYDSAATTLYISDAADLLGFVEIAQAHGSAPLLTKLGANRSFVGKTIELTADIDLNPGTTFNEDGTWTGVRPTVGWGVADDFRGTFDGKGHTISGMYTPNGLVAGQDVRYVGFAGRFGKDTAIKNLSLTNGYLCAPKSGQSAGSFGCVLHHNWGGGTVVFQNLYSDLHIYGYDAAGGIFGTTYTTDPFTVTAENLVFAGTVKSNAADTAGSYSARPAWSTAVTSNVVDFYTTSNAPVAPGHKTGVTFTYSKAPMVQKTEAQGDVFSARVLGLLTEQDLTDCANVGFVVTVKVGDTTYTADPYTTTTAWEAVNAAGEIVYAEDYASAYIYGLEINNLPVPTTENVTITVKLTRNVDGDALVGGASYSITYTAADFAN